MTKTKIQRRDVREEIYSATYVDANLFVLVEEAKALTPEVFHNSLSIESDSDGDCGRIMIYYMRPETDLELKTREIEEKRQKDYQSNRQRQEYERLKKIFEEEEAKNA